MKIPDCAKFGFKARHQAHSQLGNCWGNAGLDHRFGRCITLPVVEKPHTANDAVRASPHPTFEDNLAGRMIKTAEHLTSGWPTI